jgi:hypothetical protein
MLLVLVLETRNEGLSNRFLNSQAISTKKIKGPWNPLNHGPFFIRLRRKPRSASHNGIFDRLGFFTRSVCEQMKAAFFG